MWPNPQFLADLVTFTEEILNEKCHFLYTDFVDCVKSQAAKILEGLREKWPSSVFGNFSHSAFIAFFWILLNLIIFEKKRWASYSLSISKIIELERCGYLKVQSYKLKKHW